MPNLPRLPPTTPKPFAEPVAQNVEIDSQIRRLRMNILGILACVGDKAVCKGCGQEIYWLKHKSGPATPYMIDGTNHFINCPDREKFKRGSRRGGEEKKPEKKAFGLDDEVPFGKYKGRTVRALLESCDGVSWLRWAVENVDWFDLDDVAEADLAARIEECRDEWDSEESE